jgi:TFIIF-interacting CTD phosphatase-like protein
LQNALLRFACLNPQGIFFGNISKIFQQRHLRP